MGRVFAPSGGHGVSINQRQSELQEGSPKRSLLVGFDALRSDFWALRSHSRKDLLKKTGSLNSPRRSTLTLNRSLRVVCNSKEMKVQFLPHASELKYLAC